MAFETALNRAYDAARNRLLDRVHDRIVATLQALPASADKAPAGGDAGDKAAPTAVHAA